jgi:hypothetical protein
MRSVRHRRHTPSQVDHLDLAERPLGGARIVRFAGRVSMVTQQQVPIYLLAKTQTLIAYRSSGVRVQPAPVPAGESNCRRSGGRLAQLVRALP